MSVKVMARVFELDIPAREKLLLLAMADRSDDEGRNAYESVRTLARKSSTSGRQVQRLLRRLERAALIRPVGRSKYATVEYQITLSIADLTKLERKKRPRKAPDTVSPPCLTSRAATHDIGPLETPDIPSAKPSSNVARSVSVSKSSSKNISARSGFTRRQFIENAPLGAPDGARTSLLSFPNNASTSGPTGNSRDPQREELYRGIYGKKIKEVIFDCRKLPFDQMFREAARQAALSLCTNRSGKMIGIRYEEIATIVEQRCAPNLLALEAVVDFDKRARAIVAAVTNATIEAAIHLRATKPRPQASLFDAGVGG